MTAKRIEYPTAHLTLTGPAWPWRSTALLGLALVLAVIVAMEAHGRRPITRARRCADHSAS